MSINLAKLEKMYLLEERASKKFADMDAQEKEAYLKEHPNSKYAKGGGAKKAAAPKAPKVPATKSPTSSKKASTKAPKAKSAPAADPHEIKDIIPAAVHAPDVKTKEAKPGKSDKNAGGKKSGTTKAGKGFFPKDSWKPEPTKPGLGDTLKELFGVKRATYARLKEMASREAKLESAFARLSPAEKMVYRKANPASRLGR